MDVQKKHISVGEKKVYDHELIYARVIVLLTSGREISFESVLFNELAAYPPSMFDEHGVMRSSQKSELKKALQKSKFHKEVQFMHTLSWLTFRLCYEHYIEKVTCCALISTTSQHMPPAHCKLQLQCLYSTGIFRHQSHRNRTSEQSDNKSKEQVECICCLWTGLFLLEMSSSESPRIKYNSIRYSQMLLWVFHPWQLYVIHLP